MKQHKLSLLPWKREKKTEEKKRWRKDFFQHLYNINNFENWFIIDSHKS